MYKTKLIILDRDGVINHDSPSFIKSVDEWIALPNSILAMANLSRAGWKVCIATNQSGIGRGFFDIQTLDSMHDKMQNLLAEYEGKVSQIEYCPHLPSDNCACRKPKTAMLEKIGKDLNLPLNKALMVGDSLRDLQAGLNVGAKPVLVLTGKGSKTYEDLLQEKNPALNPKKDLRVVKDLFELSNLLLNSSL